ncbi:hypothetical protein OKW43_000980 [Paraburkholderia sp. WC7.3g]
MCSQVFYVNAKNCGHLTELTAFLINCESHCVRMRNRFPPHMPFYQADLGMLQVKPHGLAASSGPHA